MAETKCLVCDEVIRVGSGKDIFQKGPLGLRPLKERLQVVLQVNLDRRSSHSSRLCLACFKQLAVIDTYQCNIEAFSDTFQDAVVTREVAGSDSEDGDDKGPQCFTCNSNLRTTHGTENPGGKSLKTRLERVLSINLEKETTSLLGCLELCPQCLETLGRLEEELQAVTDFSSHYRTTRGLYNDDDIDYDLAGMMEDEEEQEYGEDDDSFPKINNLLRLARGEQSMYNSEIIVNYEGIEDAEKNIIKTGRSSYQCALCDFNRNGLGPMRHHVLVHAGLKPFSCRKCGNAFTERCNCIKHINKCVREKPVTPQSVSIQSADTSSGADITSAIGVPSLPQFMDLTGDVSDEETKAKKPVSKYNKIATNMGKEEYECSLCGKGFATVCATNAHMRVHKAHPPNTEERSTPDSRFFSRGTRTDKMLPSPRSLQITTESFVQLDDSEGDSDPTSEVPPIDIYVKCQSDSLVKQEEQTGNYICTKCDVVFPYRLPCIEHARIHTGERPFVCNICNKSYNRAGNYKRHYKTQHHAQQIQPNAQQKMENTHPIARQRMEKQISESILLDEESSESTATLSGIDLHVKCQSDSLVKRDELTGNYICTVCDYAPTSNASTSSYRRVIEHARVHTGEKPFICKICNKAFKNSSNYYRHRKQYHANYTPMAQQTNVMQTSRSISLDSSEPIILDSSSDDETQQLPTKKPSTIPSPVEPEPIPAVPGVTGPNSVLLWQNQANQPQLNRLSALVSAIPDAQSSDPFATVSHSPHMESTINTKCSTGESSTGMPLSINQVGLDTSPIHSPIVIGNFDEGDLVHDSDAMTAAYSHVNINQPAEQFGPNLDSTTVAQEVCDPLICFDTVNQVFKCVICPYENKHKYQIVQHIRVHSAEKPNMDEYLQHQFVDGINRHKDERTHKSEVDNALIHFDVTNQMFKCGICPYEHKKECEVRRHRRVHTGEKPFKCRYCPNLYRDHSNRRRHEQRNHSAEKCAQQETTHDAASLNSFQCEVCQVSFRYESTLKRHRELHTNNLLGSRTNQRPTVSNMLPEAPIVQPNTHGEVNKNISQLQNAFESTIEQIVTGEYRCILCCQEQSYDLDDILRHQVHSHTHNELATYKDMVNSGQISLIDQDGLGYCCKICPFRTESMTEIYSHIAQIHFVNLKQTLPIEDDAVNERLIMKKASKSMIYQCMFCPVRHRAPKILAKHVKFKHPNEFIDAKEMSADMNTAGQSTGKDTDRNVCKKRNSLPYVCMMCPHMFEEPGDLQVHFGEHIPGNVYPFTSSLRFQAWGLGATNFYACTMCGATYVNQKNLDRHVENHANIPIPLNSTFNKPNATAGTFTCPLCSAIFLGFPQLVDHMELHKTADSINPGPNQPLNPSLPRNSPPLNEPLNAKSSYRDPFDQIQDNLAADSACSSVMSESNMLEIKNKSFAHSKKPNDLSDNPLSPMTDGFESPALQPVYKSVIDKLITSVLLDEPGSNKTKRQLDSDHRETPNKRQCSSSCSNEKDNITNIKVEKVEKVQAIQISPVGIYKRKNKFRTVEQSIDLTNKDVMPAVPILRAALQKPCILPDVNLDTSNNSRTDTSSSVCLDLQDTVKRTGFSKREVRSDMEDENHESLPNCHSDTQLCDSKTLMSESDQQKLLLTTKNMLEIRSLKQENRNEVQSKENATLNVQNISISQVVSGDSAVAMVKKEVGSMDSQGENIPLEQPPDIKANAGKIELFKIENMPKYFQRLDHPKMSNTEINTSSISEVQSIINLQETVKLTAAENKMEQMEIEKTSTILEEVFEEESVSPKQLNIIPISQHVEPSVSHENQSFNSESLDNSNGIPEDNDNGKGDDNLAANIADVNDINVLEPVVEMVNTVQKHSELKVLEPDSASLCVIVNGEHSDTSSTPNSNCTGSEKDFPILASHMDKDEPDTLFCQDVQDTIGKDSNKDVQCITLQVVGSGETESSNDNSLEEPMEMSDVSNELDVIAKEITEDGTGRISHDSGDIPSSITQNSTVLAKTTSTKPHVTSAASITPTKSWSLPAVTFAPTMISTESEPFPAITSAQFITSTESLSLPVFTCAPSTMLVKSQPLPTTSSSLAITSNESQPLPTVSSALAITVTKSHPLPIVTAAPCIQSIDSQPRLALTSAPSILSKAQLHPALASTPSITSTESQTLPAENSARSITTTSSTQNKASSTKPVDDGKDCITGTLPVNIICSLCTNNFHTKLSFLQHLETHARIECPSCICIFNDIFELHRHFDELH